MTLNYKTVLEKIKGKTLAQLFSYVNPNALNEYFRNEYKEQMRYQSVFGRMYTMPNEDIVQNMVDDTLNNTLMIMPYRTIYDDNTPVVTRFVCQREMVRDYAKELMLNDGFAYWRTTGKLVVTWNNGSVTYIEYQEPKHLSVVIDCGYDESVPF